jgi:hypothetical protein
MYQNLAVLGCVLLLASPGFALEALEEEDLDRISAAGDPTVIDVKSGGAGAATAAYLDDTEYVLDFNVPHAQTGLRALTLMNIVGEAQVLQNINLLSAAQNVGGTVQKNFSAQSWGSTLPDPDTVKTVSAEAMAPACIGGPIALYGCSGGPGLFFGGGNKIGDAAAAVDTKISEAASASADVIVRAESASGPATVAVNNAGKYKLAFNESEAQKDLATLFFANVVGRAQMALNLNLAAGAVGLVPGSSDTFAEPIGGSTGVIGQSNTGIQFRGTPLVGSTGTSGGLTATVTN